MANWQHKISIKSVHDIFDDNEDSIPNVGAAMAKRLRESKPSFQVSDQRFLKELAERFSTVSTVYEYDNLLDNLYNWGDFEHKCWINSFSE